MGKGWMVLVAALATGCVAEGPAGAAGRATAPAGKPVAKREMAGAGASVVETVLGPDGKVKDELLCWREKPTGSNLAERVCRWRSNMRASHEQAADSLRDFGSTSGPNAKGN